MTNVRGRRDDGGVATWQEDAAAAARREGVDPQLFVALVRQESGGNPNARSPAGAIGYTQLMPGTARGLGVDPTNPQQNLRGGAKYLAQQLKAFGGNRQKALAAYNAGPGAVQKYGGIPPFAETQAYVKKILGSLGGAGAAAPAAVTPVSAASSGAAAAPPLDPGAASMAGIDALQAALSAQRKQQPLGSPVQAPAFAARPALAGAVPVSGGGPAARPDISPLLALAMTQGGGAGQAAAPQGAPDANAAALPASAASPKVSGLVPLGGPKNAGKGAFEVSGPDPGRLTSGLKSFAQQVAEVAGTTLVGLDGSTHSKYTVNGNVSQHYSGQATDIFTIGGKPATGARLLRAGRAALIAAGMPRDQALKAQGGLYNVGSHQIIFSAKGDAVGGDHTDHLHISDRSRK